MQVAFKKSFIKDFKELPDSVKKKVKELCTETFPDLNSFSDLKRYTPKKLRGFNNLYRIRMGDYRLGFIKEDNRIIFARALHRKDIYKHFP